MTGPKRVSERQLAANRANALRSTGPQTPEGQEASARNALKHGILSKAVIPPALESYESRADYDALLASFVESLAPEGAVEEMLVERIATSYWRLGRVLRAEAAAAAARRGQYDDGIRQQHDKELTKAKGTRKMLSQMPDDPEVRAVLQLIFKDRYHSHASDDELRSAGEALIAQLEQPLDPVFERGELTPQVACSLPEDKNLPLFMRYEAALDRQIHRALGALERLQRLRRGEFVPPAVRVVVEG
jgi:hypothetical protein